MNRRRFLAAAAAAAANPATPFADGQTAVVGGRARVLTDIIVPSARPLSGGPEPGADFASAALEAALARSRDIDAAGEADRWERLAGPAAIAIAGRRTTLQEVLLAQGAARVAPQSEDFEFIERCYAAEAAARAGRLGIWRHPAYRIRDAGRAEWARGYQIYAGVVRMASDRGRRIYFNFGEDFRADFTATAERARFRRWRRPIDLEAIVGRRMEVRGYVESINGPSIELRHELQLRLL
jgi:endonuclease YncB( thermonuclease family)